MIVNNGGDKNTFYDNFIEALYILSAVLGIEDYAMNVDQMSNEEMLKALEDQTEEIKIYQREILDKLDRLLERQ